MNKTKLQELCHKLHWNTPEYSHRRMGPDHEARYSASVSVNGSVFESPDADSRSTKEAHNKAAGVALESLSPIAAVVAPSTPAAVTAMTVVQSPSPRAPQTEGQITFKSQLQIYAQKRSKELPKYTTIREGSPQTPLFKSSVTINGETFQSPKFFNSVKEAEHAAAEVALSHLPQEEETSLEISLDESAGGSNYKTMLQEIMMKEKKLLPVYLTVKHPNTKIPIFSSTVEIDGLSFKGEDAKSKKLAETNAAKAALQHLKDRKQIQVSSGLSTSISMYKPVQDCSANEKLNGIKPKLTNQSVSPSSPIRILKRDEVLTGNHKFAPLQSTNPLPNNPKTEPIKTAQTYNMDPIQNANSGFKESTKTGSTESTISGGQSSSSDHGPVSAVKKENGKGGGVESSFFSHRIQIFPCKPKLALPPGATLLPCSDDMWVAVELDYHEGSNDACMYASMSTN